MKVTLAQKAVLVIVVPVLFQLGFLAFLTNVFHQLDQGQAMARQLTDELIIRDKIRVGLAQRYTYYGLYRASHEDAYRRAFIENVKDVNRQFRKLYEMWKGDPRRRGSVIATFNLAEPSNRLMYRFLLQPSIAHTVLELFGGPLGVKLAATQNAHARNALDFVFDEDAATYHKVQDKMASLEKTLSGSLLISLLVSTVCSIVAGLYFSRSITERLKQILMNIRALERKQGLLVPVRGTDEIATLDGVIAQTSAKIRAAEKFQAETGRIIAGELERPLDQISDELEVLKLQGFVELSEKGKDRLVQASGQVERLRSLVQDIAVLDSIKEAGYDLKIGSVDLAAIAEEAIVEVTEFASSKHVQIKSQLAPLVVRADRARVMQVVINLLSNAIKFSPPDSIIEIAVLTDERHARLTVTDHGIGIPPEFQAKIFSKFEQARASDATEKKGSGLGLALSKKLVEAQGGQMNFQSTPGVATTFWFSLPLISADWQQPSASGDRSKDKAQRWKQTLWVKALALVLLPMLLQVATVAVLWSALHAGETSLRELDRGRKITAIHGRLTADLSRATWYALLYSCTKVGYLRENAERECDETRTLEGALEDATKDNSVLAEQTKHLKQIVDSTIERVGRILSTPKDAELMGLLLPPGEKRADRVLIECEEPLKKALDQEDALIRSNPVATAELRQRILSVLIGAAILDALLALGLGLFVVQAITRRVKAVSANANRLSKLEQLQEPQPGTDELAFLDKSFFEAGNRLLELEQFKQQLISVTSHELRTPLSSLLSLFEIVNAGVFGELTETGKRICDKANREISDLINLINDLLDLEKMKSGKRLISQRTADAVEMLSSLKQKLEQALQQTNVRVSFQPTTEKLEAAFDGERVAQALAGLVKTLADQVDAGDTIELSVLPTAQSIDFVVSASKTTVLPKSDSSELARRRLAFSLARTIAQQHDGKLLVTAAGNQRSVSLRLPLPGRS